MLHFSLFCKLLSLFFLSFTLQDIFSFFIILTGYSTRFFFFFIILTGQHTLYRSFKPGIGQFNQIWSLQKNHKIYQSKLCMEIEKKMCGNKHTCPGSISYIKNPTEKMKPSGCVCICPRKVKFLIKIVKFKSYSLFFSVMLSYNVLPI